MNGMNGVNGVKKGLCVLAVIFGLALVLPVSAAQYSPGVSVGQYVNLSYTTTLTRESIPVWYKMEVVAVSGKEVTVRICSRARDGTVTERPYAFNVETGTQNGTPIRQHMVIAANLSQGNVIPPVEFGLTVNRTETRTYLGTSRTVNIVSWEESAGTIHVKWVIVYDRESGMVLETEIESSPPPVSASHGLLETNIFPSTPIPEPVAALATMTFMAIVASTSTRRRN